MGDNRTFNHGRIEFTRHGFAVDQMTQLLAFDIRPGQAVNLQCGPISVDVHVKEFCTVQREHGEDVAATFTIDGDGSQILLTVSSMGLFYDQEERRVHVWPR
jgi:hypothetical protein